MRERFAQHFNPSLLPDSDRMLVSILKKIGVKFSLNDPHWGRDPEKNNKNQNQDGKKPPDGPPDLTSFGVTSTSA